MQQKSQVVITDLHLGSMHLGSMHFNPSEFIWSLHLKLDSNALLF